MPRLQFKLKNMLLATAWFAVSAALVGFIYRTLGEELADGLTEMAATFALLGTIPAFGAGVGQLFGKPGWGPPSGSMLH